MLSRLLRNICSRIRIAYTPKMNGTSCPEGIVPPEHVKGMKILDKTKFTREICVPCIRVPPTENLNKLMPIIKPTILKLRRYRPVFISDSRVGWPMILLDPEKVKTWSDLPADKLSEFQVEQSSFSLEVMKITYENFQLRELLRSVLPDDAEGVSSYSQIGHIVHVNLRDELLPYKTIVGQMLFSHVPNCRTVVNKTNNIDTVYRNFELELLAGELDYIAKVKENGVTFEFDFSKVYWNSRLATEHDRIVQIVQPIDTVYDVFAGVGPFSIPIAKKHKCRVLANDLNPESVKYLRHNKKLNKIGDNLEVFNKDGKDFIRQDIKSNLDKEMTHCEGSPKTVHIVMNLPEIAKEFLRHFVGLISDREIIETWNPIHLRILVHVYCFVRDEDLEGAARSSVEEHLGSKLSSESIQNIAFVRNVAPKKDMMRVSFYLSKEVLFREPEADARPDKRKLDQDDTATERKKATSS